MEEREERRVGSYWGWGWAAASAAQLGLGISSIRKGHPGDSTLMPFKAFSVSSLFVGAIAAAAMASLRLSGVNSAEDMKTLGTNIRSGLGLRSRTDDHK